MDAQSLCRQCGKRLAKTPDGFCQGRCRYDAKREIEISPTPAEIEERAARVQSQWSDKQRQLRETAATRTKHAEVQIFYIHDVLESA